MKRAVVAVVGLVVLVVGGTWTYLNVIEDDAPAPLSLQTGTTVASAATPTSAGVDGTWNVASGSQAGYRVKEVLFGQSAEAVGRTGDVTGSVTIAGTTVTEGAFTVDMATVASDESRRDNQFRGRVMAVSTYPTSTFVLTQPIDLGGTVPADGAQVKATATGKLTLRGTTKTVTFDVDAQRTGAQVKIAGAIPIVFSEWGIPNPSFGPAQTDDHGVLEFLLVLRR